MHFDFPFSFSSLTRHAREVEQDTIDDVENCVAVAILTEYGFRPEVPTYGVPDQAFELQPLNLETIVNAVEVFEPRAALLLEQQAIDLVAKINAAVSLRAVI